MRTRGEIESAISEGMSRFQQEYMGRGPKDVHVHLINDLVVCRLKGVLTAAEEHLVKTLPADKGRDLLKQVRSHLMETARPIMEAMVQVVDLSVFNLNLRPLFMHQEVVGSKSAHIPADLKQFTHALVAKDPATFAVCSASSSVFQIRRLLLVFLRLTARYKTEVQDRHPRKSEVDHHV